MSAPACRWAAPLGVVGSEVVQHLSEQAGPHYGSDIGAVVVHFCERCDCVHVGVISHRPLATERVVEALQQALVILKEETHGTEKTN